MANYPINDRELASLTQTEIDQSMNWAGSEWREAIKQSLNYLMLRLKGDEIEGRTQFQSGDVADMLDHVQAEMQPLYGTNDLICVAPEGPYDEGYDAESRALNWYWKERARGFEKIDSAIQDGLLSRNGYLKVWYEESYGLPYEQELNGDRLQIDAALEQLGQENRIEIVEEEMVQAEMTESVIAAGPDGITPIQTDMVTMPAQFRVVLKITPLVKQVKIDSVAPEDMGVSKDATDSDMQKPRFVSQRRRMARMDAIALGLDPDEVMRIPTTTREYYSDVRIARKSDYNTYSRHAAHESGQPVDIYECYYRIDRDGDGIPELWKFFYSQNREILHWAPREGEEEGESTLEMVRVRPFCSGSPMKVAHRHDGRSLWDKEYQIEDVKRTLVRQMITNFQIANDSTMLIGRGVEPEQAEETAIGRIIVCDSPTADVVELPHNDITSQSLQGLAYFDKIRRERAGSAIDISGESMPVSNAAHSTERVMSAMEKLVAMYARNFAQTMVRDAAVLLHQQLKLLPGRLAFEDGEGWAETQPHLWIDRTRITIKFAETDGEKMRKAAALTQTIETQRADMEGPFAALISPKAAYEARVDRDRNAGLSDPGQYWVDPDSEEGQDNQRQIDEAAEADAQMQQQMAAQQMQAAQQMLAMQEETKRLQSQMKAMEEQRERMANMMVEFEKIQQKYVELELEYGEDIPGEGLEDGEVIDFEQSAQ